MPARLAENPPDLRATIQIRYNKWAAHPDTFALYITKDGWHLTKPLTWADTGRLPFSTATDRRRWGTHELVTAVTALAAMLWQYAHPADSLRSLYEEDPWLARAVVDFVPRLASMTQNLITGMLVHSQAEATAKTGKQDP